MTNETIDYEQLVKAKYPDAVLKKNYFVGYILRTEFYWIEIKSIHFTTERQFSYYEYFAWPIAYNELKSQNLI